MLQTVFLFKILFFLFMAGWVFVATHRLSLVAASRGYSLFSVLCLLITVASLVAEQGLQGVQA